MQHLVGNGVAMEDLSFCVTIPINTTGRTGIIVRAFVATERHSTAIFGKGRARHGFALPGYLGSHEETCPLIDEGFALFPMFKGEAG
jgi:hypothetical protein